MTKRARDPARRLTAQRGEEPAPTLVTERDCRILAFVAEHRIVLAAQVQALLGVSEAVVNRRLAGLAARGLIEHSRVLHGQPRWYQITRPGLALLGSDLPTPRLDLRCYRHDIGVAWVWLAAARGALGRVERIVSEREMRSRDGASAAAGLGAAAGRGAGGGLGAAAGRGAGAGRGASPFGVHLGGVGPRGHLRLHYPDLLLAGPGGERVAVELELSAKGGRRLETILAGYGADPGIDAVLYLAERPSIAREVRATAARLGISHLVHVHPVVWGAGADPAAKAPTRGAARVPTRASARAPTRVPACAPAHLARPSTPGRALDARGGLAR